MFARELNPGSILGVRMALGHKAGNVCPETNAEAQLTVDPPRTAATGNVTALKVKGWLGGPGAVGRKAVVD